MGRFAVGVVGCGSMGSALAEALILGGQRVLLAGGRGRTAAALAATLPGAHAVPPEVLARDSAIVFLATRLPVTRREVAPLLRGPLEGTVVVDLSNPEPADLRDPEYDSAGELVAELFPRSPVVKALNCVSARRLRAVAHGAPAPTVPIAGNDPAAKQCVSYLLERLGFDVADAGPLHTSKWIEGLAALLRTLAEQEGLGDAVGFRLLRADMTANDQTGVRR
ncbi:NADPH-dependent F420 reductase [Nonomuraea wenchangensis]